MAHPYNNKSPFNCWKGYERVPGTQKGAKGSCRKSSPANATKGGGTTKVCLPKAKVNNMSAEQKKKVVNAKESAGRSGRRERSQGSEVKGARKKGATLKDWFEKENWVNVKTGEECGAPTKRETSKINESSRGMKALKTAYDVGSTFLKGGLGVASTMLTPATAYAQGQPMPEFIEGGVDNRSLEEFERDGPIPLPKFKEETPLNKAEPRRTIGKGKNFNKVSEDKSATGGAAGGGMTQKGVDEYKKKNPGSNLQTAVTEKPSELKPGSKKAKRRKSFCARSKGWKGERGRAARKRWRSVSYTHLTLPTSDLV